MHVGQFCVLYFCLTIYYYFLHSGCCDIVKWRVTAGIKQLLETRVSPHMLLCRVSCWFSSGNSIIFISFDFEKEVSFRLNPLNGNTDLPTFMNTQQPIQLCSKFPGKPWKRPLSIFLSCSHFSTCKFPHWSNTNLKLSINFLSKMVWKYVINILFTEVIYLYTVTP